LNLRKAWDKHAEEWIRWARTEGHDQPVPDDDLIRDQPKMARWRRVPMFLQVRVVKP
jgi:hypothetical protein